MAYSEAKNILDPLGFTLGGNWDYDRGSFDCALDDGKKTWIRIPFRVVSGSLDSEQEAQDTLIRFDAPYVLRHIYNEGIDHKAGVKVAGGLIDQFQEPVDPDAPVDPLSEQLAKDRLREAEAALFG